MPETTAQPVYETYELLPPRIMVQHIRTQEDLEQLQITLEANGKNDGPSMRYYRKDWRGGFEYAVTGEPYFKDGDLYTNTYHSGYGNSTETRSHFVAGIGTSIAVNLNLRQAVFLGDLMTKSGSRTLEARDLPPEMLQPVLRKVDH